MLRVRVGLEKRRAFSTVNFKLVEEPGLSLGMKSSQTPELPSRCISLTRPSQLLKSPTTLTPEACGAQTAKVTPFLRPTVATCAPSFL